MVTTTDRLFGGRVVHIQPSIGYRSGIEPVLLAAAVSAKSGHQVLEAGTGAGTALLCLHARVQGIRSVGVEINEAVATLARSNAAANGFTELEVMTSAIEATDLPRRFDHAIANPPYHPADGTASPVAGREGAKRSTQGLGQRWIDRLAQHLRHRGSLTLILPAGVVPEYLTAMTTSGCSCTVIYPLWPMAGWPAKLVLLRGIRNARTPMRIKAGLVLHEANGSFTAAAESILRDGQALEL